MRPLIVTTTTTHDDSEFRTPQVVLGSPYLRAVERFGGTPLLVTPVHDESSIAQILDIANGVVLTGGEDVDPSLYGLCP